MKDFIFPPSVQSDLFNYLKDGQRETLKPILRLVKRKYQETLCVSLLDYLEGNGLAPTGQPVLDQMAQSIIGECGLRPLKDEGLGMRGEGSFASPRVSKEPQSIGTILKQMLPALPKSLNPPLGSAACIKQEL